MLLCIRAGSSIRETDSDLTADIYCKPSNFLSLASTIPWVAHMMHCPDDTGSAQHTCDCGHGMAEDLKHPEPMKHAAMIGPSLTSHLQARCGQPVTAVAQKSYRPQALRGPQSGAH